ncbi:MAG: phage minor head protein, partial [Pseudomonadales bacterium]
GDVDQELFDLISAQLTTALDQGFSEAFNKLTPGTKEHELMLQLRENVFVFSGFKTYQELQEASKLLINEAGVIRPFAEFRDEVLKLHQQYDLNYLRTEYNMAVGNAQAAEFWLQVEENSAAKPYLRFSAILDTVSRHKKYHGITRRWDDPIWEWLTPLLDYGCRCLLQMLAEAEVTSPNKLPDPTGIPEMFRFNPGKQKAVFPKNHPYYEVASEDQQAADNLWNLKKPDGDT